MASGRDRAHNSPPIPPKTVGRPGDGRVLAALLLVSAALGSIHAYSVLLDPLEDRLGVGRGSVSLAYSLALASLTVAVAVGHRLYHLAPPSVIVVAVCAAAAGGLVLASTLDAVGGGLSALWIGYGLVFGFSNGVGYGYALALANDRIVVRRSLAMASVTAVYAVGAAIAAVLLDRLAGDGPRLALLGLAATLVGVGAIAAWLVRGSGAIARPDSGIGGDFDAADRRWLAIAWLTYGTGVSAGLMALGHAAGVVEAMGGTALLAVVGAVAITLMNAIGGFGVGWIADRGQQRLVLVALGLVSAAALTVAAIGSWVGLMLVSLGIIGGAYGATISLFPIVTAQRVGPDRYARAYGRIFTSWGVAGLLAPWMAGALFDRTGSYTVPLVVAACLAAASAGLATLLGG